MKKIKILFFVFLWGFILFASQVFAAEIWMEDGTVLEGEIIEESGESITLRGDDWWREIPRKEIKRIVRDEDKIEEETDPPLKEEPKEPEKEVQKKEKPIEKDPSPQASKKFFVSLDMPGTHKITLGGESSEASVNLGFSFALEVLNSIEEIASFGVGVSYQIPRSQSDYPGSFSFAPVYGLIQINMTSEKSQEIIPYIVGRLGYNIMYSGDYTYTGDGDLSGGLYYGAGFGLIFDSSFLLEAQYSLNEGAASYSGYDPYLGYYDVNIDVDYSKFSISAGLLF